MSVKVKRTPPNDENSAEYTHILKIANHRIPAEQMKNVYQMMRWIIKNNSCDCYSVDIEIRGVHDVEG